MTRLIDADELERYIDNCDFCDRCPDASPRCQIDCEMPDFLTKRWKRVIDAQPTVDAQSEIDRLNRLGLTWYDTILKLMEMVNGTDQWIPCSERLPAKTGHYLCSFKKPNRIDNIFVDLAYWTGSRWYGYLANEINAWMPLPDRYEAERKEE